ncbi:astacin [Oesophagostomum dentatum]|uniref:Metalloendopeptidase n=1 Tax=Oesophagostomum dentatum TaxID=61180 RepID=A0A0B1TCW4_OESDE|nr:astacin [Oesophagostomum dentatum]
MLVLAICALFFTVDNVSSARNRRNALPPNSDRKWDKYLGEDGKFVIPYEIEGNYTSDEHQLLYEQMDKIAKNTCVKCNSAVGRPGGESVISLESSKFGSCFDRGTLMRFLLHTVGLYGEQMREDRDKYIRVHDENIIDGYEHFFTKILDASSYGVPYDYLSIMHYGKNEYAKPGTITIETLDDRLQDLIGKQTEPTGNDYVKVCLMYNCKTCMGTETLVP